MTLDRNYLTQDVTTVTIMDCPVCKGRGFTEDYRRCNICKGEGVVAIAPVKQTENRYLVFMDGKAPNPYVPRPEQSKPTVTATGRKEPSVVHAAELATYHAGAREAGRAEPTQPEPQASEPVRTGEIQSKADEGGGLPKLSDIAALAVSAAERPAITDTAGHNKTNATGGSECNPPTNDRKHNSIVPHKDPDIEWCSGWGRRE